MDKNGIRESQKIPEAILNASQPVNVTPVKAFLASVSYYSRFIPNLAAVAYPLNQLPVERTFYAIENEITSDRVLTLFNPKLHLVLVKDAFPCVCTQCHASRKNRSFLFPELYVTQKSEIVR